MGQVTAIPELATVISLGNLLGIKTEKLITKLSPLAACCGRALTVTFPHRLDAIAVTTRAPRALALELCGGWLDQLAGDEIELEVGAAIAARSDEAALPPGSPDAVTALGGELAALGFDGAAWTYVTEQSNTGAPATEATIERFVRVAEHLGVTTAQRNVASGLHRSLARGAPTRVSLNSRSGTLEPRVTLGWDRVEWMPIQSMLSGFYPSLGVVGQIPRIAKTCGVDDASVELVLGPTDPPGLRIAMHLVRA